MADEAGHHLRGLLARPAGAVQDVGRQAFRAASLLASRDQSVLASPHIEPGAWAVVEYHGEAVAIHRDAAGALHAVSAHCTHADELLTFDAEAACWECPRHGARFALDGRVLRGPASAALRQWEVGDLEHHRA